MRAAIKAFSEYLLGNDQTHGLRHYVPEKRVNTYAGVWQTFPDRQADDAGSLPTLRKWCELKIPYQGLEVCDDWELQGDEYRKNIVNKLPYAPYVMGIAGQSRMSRKIGWRSWLEVVQSNMKGAMRAANQAVAKWIKTRK